MILINLLPHREVARKRARQIFGVMLGMAVLSGLVISSMIYLWYQGRISDQRDRNDILTAEIAKLEKEIKEVAGLQEEIAALKARQQAVESLQTDRNMSVHLMNELVQKLPEGIYLRSIRQESGGVLISGEAQSNERVSEFLRNLSGGGWLKKPELVEIVAANAALSAREQVKVHVFTIRAQVHRPVDDDGMAEAGVSKPSASS